MTRTEILWRQEKYNVMFHSQKHYNLIRQAMHTRMPQEEIEQLIREALMYKPTTGSMQNACQHMWGYFKKFATTEEKKRYTELSNARDFQQLLSFLKQLADHYEVKYLMESCIFTHF